MNKNTMNLGLACVALGLLGVPGVGKADWRLGVGLDYVSGLSDVANLYMDNISAPFGVSTANEFDEFKLPVGLKFTGDYEWKSGFRVDFNVGPVLLVMADLTVSGASSDDESFTYTDVPVGITAGYSFMRNSNVSPYVRLGAAQHFVSGDFNESASPGLLAAVGVDFMRTRKAQVSVELSLDQSEVEFDRIRCSTVGTNCLTTRESLNTSNILFGVAVKF